MTEQNKAVVRQLFDEVWNTGRLDKIEGNRSGPDGLEPR